MDETYTETVTHWGVRLKGSNIVRWDPTYGRGPGFEEYYTEEQARAEAKHDGGTAVTRTETTTVITTPWMEA
jgi:hypothetical protein